MIDTMALGRPGVVAAYLVRGKENALIDMGYASSAETVLRDLESSGFAAESIDYLLPTHVHLDHSGACGALAALFMAAAIRVHPKGEQHLVNPALLWEAASELFGEGLMKQYGRPLPINGNRIKTIGDGDKINLGNGLTLLSIWTPGHASHHLSYLLEEEKMVFTGDAVGISSPGFPILIPTTPPTSFNLTAAVESLRRIRQSSPKRLLTPHFGIVEDPLDSIDANIHCLEIWTAKIERMLNVGFAIEAIVTTLTDDIASAAQKQVKFFPDYLRVSIRLSVLGAVRYLKFFKNTARK